MYIVWPNEFLCLEIARPYLGTLFCLTELLSFMMFPFRKKTRSERNQKLFPLVLASVFPSDVF